MNTHHLANAGKMIPADRRRALNAATLERMRQAISEADALMQDDHVVLGVETVHGAPTVQLAASPRLAAMADEDRGAYYMRGVDAQGQHYRKGILLGRTPGVRVVWIERGH
jgi:hypothetical protein